MRDLIALRKSKVCTRIITSGLVWAFSLGLTGCVASLAPSDTTIPNSNAGAGNGNANNANANSNTNANSGNQNSGGAGQRVDVAIIDFSFQPMSVTISVGDRVRWTNNDDRVHEVTSGSPGDEDEGQEFASGPINTSGTFEHTFDTPGTFLYFDGSAPDLLSGATVIVQGP